MAKPSSTSQATPNQTDFALVTGASSGIGLELARRFAQDGIHLILVARTTNKLQELARELEASYRVRCVVIAIDLSQPDAPQTIFNECRNLGLHVNYLVNNAGFGSYGPFLDTEWGVTQRMMQVNMRALTELTYLFGRPMRERGRGHILNVASTAAFQPGPLMSVYYASKAYVLSFSEALAEELQDSGVLVTALCPGPTASNFQSTAKMEKVKLFEKMRPPSSKQVADYGYKAMMQGQRVAIEGVMNFMITQSVRVTPRRWVTKIVKSLQS